MTTRPRRRSSALLLLLLLGAVLTLTSTSAARAQDAPGDDPSSTSTTLEDGTLPHIIPRPNSGHPPREAGDRGGALQLGLLAVIVVALGTILALIVRESRRARSRRGPG